MTTTQSILDFLDAHATNPLTAEDVVFLRQQLSELSVNVVNANSDAITILYSGILPDGTHTGSYAQAISANNLGEILIIDDTELGQFLKSADFKDSLFNALGDEELYRSIYTGENTGGIRINNTSLWDEASSRFVANAQGNVRIISPDGSLDRIFAQTELPALLSNPNVTHIEGIPVDHLRALIGSGNDYSAVANDIFAASTFNIVYSNLANGDYETFVKSDVKTILDDLDAVPERINNAQNFIGLSPEKLDQMLDLGKRLGYVGTGIGLFVVASQASAEVVAGNPDGAKDVVIKWVAEEIGANAGAFAASGAATALLSVAAVAAGVTIAAPVGIAAVFAASVAGSFLGTDAAAEFYDYLDSLDHNDKKGILDRLGDIFTGPDGTISATLPEGAAERAFGFDAMHVNMQGSNGSIITSANGDMAWRYALLKLNPFVITNFNYSEHNVNGILDAYNPETGEGFMTDAWIEARAAMIGAVDAMRTGSIDSLLGESTVNIQFVDRLNGGEILVSIQNGAYQMVPVQYVLFDHNETSFIETAAGNDTIFAAGGDDAISSGEGDDYIEAGEGDDLIFGGEGNDFLQGGLGNDTYIWKTGDGNDVIIENADGNENILNIIIKNADGSETIQLLSELEFEKTPGDNRYYVQDPVAGGVKFVALYEDNSLKIFIEDPENPENPDAYITIKNFVDDNFGLNLDDVDDIAIDPLPDPDDVYQVLEGVLPGSPSENPTYMSISNENRQYYYGVGSNEAPDPSISYDAATFYGATDVSAIYYDNDTGETIYNNHSNPRNFELLREDINNETTFRYIPVLQSYSFEGGDNDDVLVGGDWHEQQQAIANADHTMQILTDEFYIVQYVRAGSTAPAQYVGDMIDGGDGNDQIYGNAAIENNEAQPAGDADILIGGRGNDVIKGGSGNDLLFGTSLNMTSLNEQSILVSQLSNVDTQALPQGITSSTRLHSVFVSNNETLPALSEIENIGDENNLDGGAGHDELEGGSYKDRLLGGAGNDWLFGGVGKDTLIAGADNDVVFGDSSKTTLQYLDIDNNGINDTDSEGTTFYTYATQLITPSEHAEDAPDTDFNRNVLYNPEDFDVDEDYIDRISGGTGNDRLFGEIGNDDISGGDGDDWIHGDRTNDIGEFLAIGFEDYFTELEGMYHGIDNIDGGSGNDTIDGNGGADLIDGGSGNDFIRGDDDRLAGEFHGNDDIDGGTGDDIVEGNGGNDTLYGGEGSDKLIGDWMVDIGIKHNNSIRMALDEQFHGEDTIYGGAGDDFIFGNGGDDTLYGDGDNDYIDGNADNDTIYGGAGNDTLYGGEGDDIIYGGDGDDYIVSGSVENDSQGDDTLHGGAGNDVYVVDAGVKHISVEGHDELVLVDDSADIYLDLSGVTLDDLRLGEDVTGAYGLLFTSASDFIAIKKTDYSQVTLNLAGGAVLLTDFVATYAQEEVPPPEDFQEHAGQNAPIQSGTAADDVLQGNINNNTIVSGAGNDTVSGYAGKDTLYGGDGDDTLDGGSGDDYLDAGEGNNLIDPGTGNNHIVLSNYYNEEENYVDTVIMRENFGSNIIDGSSNNLIINFEAINRSGVKITPVTENGLPAYLFTWGDGATLTLYTENIQNINLQFADGNVTFDDFVNHTHHIHASELGGVLTGTPENDHFYSAGGADTFIGGEGNDVYHLLDVDEQSVVENANEGNDTLVVAEGGRDYNLSDFANVENLTFTGEDTAFNVIGSTLDNTVDSANQLGNFYYDASTGGKDTLLNANGAVVHLSNVDINSITKYQIDKNEYSPPHDYYTNKHQVLDFGNGNTLTIDNSDITFMLDGEVVNFADIPVSSYTVLWENAVIFQLSTNVDIGSVDVNYDGIDGASPLSSIMLSNEPDIALFYSREINGSILSSSAAFNLTIDQQKSIRFHAQYDGGYNFSSQHLHLLNVDDSVDTNVNALIEGLGGNNTYNVSGEYTIIKDDGGAGDSLGGMDIQSMTKVGNDLRIIGEVFVEGAGITAPSQVVIKDWYINTEWSETVTVTTPGYYTETTVQIITYEVNQYGQLSPVGTREEIRYEYEPGQTYTNTYNYSEGGKIENIDASSITEVFDVNTAPEVLDQTIAANDFVASNDIDSAGQEYALPFDFVVPRHADGEILVFTDREGDLLSISQVTNLQNAELVHSTRNYLYFSFIDPLESASFDYVITDGQLVSNTATLTITPAEPDAPDVITGTEGDDWLFGTNGDDIINGGAGNDALIGGDGRDVYLYAEGDGHDFIYDINDIDEPLVLSFAEGITPDDIYLSLNRSELTFYINDGEGSVSIDTAYGENIAISNIIDEVHFSDGTVWSSEYLVQMIESFVSVDINTDHSLLISFAEGIAPGDITFATDYINLTLIINDGGFSVDVPISWAENDFIGDVLGEVHFSDGTVWSSEYLNQAWGRFVLVDGYWDSSLQLPATIDRDLFMPVSDASFGDAEALSISIIGDANLVSYDSETDTFSVLNYSDTQYYSVYLEQGETLTLDVDHKYYEWLDTSLTLYASDGSYIASNDNSDASLGGVGSVPLNDESSLSQDAYLDFTATTSANYIFAVQIIYDDEAYKYGQYHVSVSIKPPAFGNTAPVLVADNIAGVEDQAIIITFAELLGNDTDAQNDALTIVSISGDENGTYVIGEDEHGSGIITFTPVADFNGNAQFTYTVSDGVITAEASVTIAVAAVNDAPVIVDEESFLSVKNQPMVMLVADLLHNDSDIDGDVLSITQVSGDNGTYVLGQNVNGEAIITYTPTEGFEGNASFTYTVSDGQSSVVSQATVSVFNQIITGTSANNTISGSAGNDYIHGGAGLDTIGGNDGNDMIIGGLGNDTLNGGTGNDIFIVEGNGQGADIFNGGLGYDVIQGGYGDDVFGMQQLSLSAGIELIDGKEGFNIIEGTSDNNNLNFTYVTLSNIAYINGGSGIDTIVGSSGNDTIMGGEGNDSLYGNDGDDIIIGDGGDDTLNGGDGSDVFIVNGINQGSDRFLGGTGVDSVLGSSDDDIIMVDAVLLSDSIEEINGGLGYDVIKGSASANTIDLSVTQLIDIEMIDGGDGNDVITGSVANDYILGGNGADTLKGVAGDDIIFGDSGNDVIYGGIGNDLLFGGVGDDTLYGEDGDDIFVSEGTAQGVDRFIGGNGYDQILGGDNNDTFILSSLYQTDSVEIIDGGSGLNSILGSSSANTLDFSLTTLVNIAFIDGGAGNDIITATEFNDIVYGGSNNDTINAGLGDDYIEGGHGLDNINAGDGSDIVMGGDHDDVINGAGGSDILDGGLGSDTLIGGEGNDTIYGGDHNDTITGGIGDDYIVGGSGHDDYIFNAGDGSDTLLLGDALSYVDQLMLNDININNLVFTRSGNNMVMSVTGSSDQITFVDWYTNNSNKMDQIIVSGQTLTPSIVEALVRNVVGTALSENFTGSEYDDVISGNGGADSLYGGAGDDILIGGSGDDHLYGDAGNDTYIFTAGNESDIIHNTDASGTDSLTINDYAKEDIWFTRGGADGQDLLINMIGTTDLVVVDNWYTGSKLDEVDIGNYHLDTTAIEQLVNAMSAFAVPSSAGQTLPGSVEDIYQNSLVNPA